MGQPGKEQMLWGSAVLLSKALVTSFCFALETELFYLHMISPLAVSPIPFYKPFIPGFFSRFDQPSPSIFCITSFSPGHGFSCPFCAFGSEMSPQSGPRSGLLDAAVILTYQ